MRTPIQSVKHIIQYTLTQVMSGTTAAFSVIVAEQDYTGSANRVPVGAVVKAVYIELWAQAGSSQPGTLSMSVEKVVAGAPSMTFLQAQSLHDYPNKKNIYYFTQGIVGDSNTNPIPFIRMWIKIPKGKQRFGLGDKVVINVTSISEDIEYCGMAIVKHYT